MARRLDTQAPSTATLNLTLTPEAEERIKALAWYLRVHYSHLLRSLAQEKRDALHAEGKRPPLRPRDGGPSHSGPKGRHGAKYLFRKVRVSTEERDEIHALAQYLGMAVNELLVSLVDAKRAELYAAGQRPPLRIPDAYLLDDSAQGQWLPRK
jgi:hypothetical protein